MGMRGTDRLSAAISPRDLESMLGWTEGILDGIAWMLLLEESQGITRGMIAKHLKVEEEQLAEVVCAVTQLEGEAAEGAWQQALLILKTSHTLNKKATSLGWDSIEAIAVEKLSRSLAQMASNGDAMQMLEIATKANKAIRRADGESGSVGRGPGATVPVGAGGVDLTLSAGNLGVLHLQLSPRIQEQLAQPSKVIDGIANRMSGEATETSQLKMLTLKDTRELVQSEAEKSALEKNESMEIDVDSFEELLNGIGSRP